MQQLARLPGPFPTDGDYVSPVHGVERVRVRLRSARARRPDFVSLYLSAGVAGVVFGFAISVLA